MSDSKLNLPFQFFVKAYGSLNIGIAVVVESGAVFYVNKAFCSILKTTPNVVNANKISAIGFKQNKLIDETLIKKFFSGAIDDHVFEKKIDYNSTDTVWLRVRMNASIESTGSVEYVLLSLEDISESKKILDELHSSEEKSKAMSETTHEALFFSYKGKCIDCNLIATDLFGYSYEEAIGMHATDIVAPQSVELVKENLLSGYMHPYEAFAKRKNGSVFWAEFHGKMFPYKGKEIRVTAVRDISDRKKLEAKKETIEYNYKMLFENMNEAFAYHKIILDKNGKPIDYTYLDVNPVFERLTGIKRTDVIGKRVLEVLPKLEYSWIEKFGEVALNGKPIQYTNYVAELKKHFETRVYSPQKEYFAVAFTDVSKRMEIDKEISFHNDRLKSIVRLSQVNVSDYIELLIETEKEAISLVNGICGAIYFYDSDKNTYDILTCKPAENPVPEIADKKKIIELFRHTLKLGKSKCWNKKALQVHYDREAIELESFICIPAKTKRYTSVIFGIGSKDKEFTEQEIKHLDLFTESVLQLIEKQKFQDQILSEKLKAEINETRYFEIQKAGKIGWYEALLDEGLFLGSFETYEVFFDEYYDYPVTNKHIMDALHPDDREHFFNTVKSNTEQKKHEFDWEYRVITPKSGLKYVYSKAFLKYDSHGNLLRRYGIVQDITKIKQFELELKRHNDRLESLFKISQLTKTTTAELLDKALKEALELTSSTIGFIFRYNKQKQKYTLDAYSKDKLKEFDFKRMLESALKDKKNFLVESMKNEKACIENTFDLNSDKNFLKELSIKNSELNNLMMVPITISKNELLWIAVINNTHIYNDVDIKQLTLLMDSIWKIVERQNYEEELVKAKEHAEESDKLKSAFLANMSHEIRTPMNGIIGFSELISQDDITEDKRVSYANIVVESGKQLLTIVDDILDISKIEVGQVSITKQPVLINDVITTMFSFYNPRAKNLNISLFPYRDLNDEQSIINTDKQRLIQVFNNLLSNAFKFTSQGEISFGYLHKGKQLEFYIKDTGCGIPKDMLKTVFERFRQAEQQKTRNFRGTGLGLSISQKLIELLGGKIWVESELDVGSTFFFTLPYNPDKKKTTSKQKAKRDEPENNITILIAEDEEINFLYLDEVLAKPGAKILHAKNGEQAIELSKKHAEINLILMDIKMPVMDGYIASKKIRKLRPNLPIIAVTAFAMEADREKALEAGCTDYLSKPLSKQLLSEMIAKYVTEFK